MHSQEILKDRLVFLIINVIQNLNGECRALCTALGGAIHIKFCECVSPSLARMCRERSDQIPK